MTSNNNNNIDRWITPHNWTCLTSVRPIHYSRDTYITLISGVSRNFLLLFVCKISMETTGFRRNISRKSTGFRRKVYWNPTVLWDVDDLLTLYSLDPKLVYGNITSQLEDMGCIGFTSLTAFVDDNITPDLEDMYGSAGFIFSRVPNYGTKYARVHTMAVETLIWALDKQSIPSILIILSKSMGEEKQLASLIEAIKKQDNYDIVFLDPTNLLGKSRGSPSKTPIYCCECKKPLIKEGESSSQNQ